MKLLKNLAVLLVTLDKQKQANTEESSWWDSISTKLEELINVNKDTKKATQKLNGNINGR